MIRIGQKSSRTAFTLGVFLMVLVLFFVASPQATTAIGSKQGAKPTQTPKGKFALRLLPISMKNVAQIADLGSFPGHQLPRTGLAISPDGKLVASASADQTITLWDLQSATQRTVLQSGSGTLGVAFSMNSQLLATGGNRIQIWDLKTGKALRVLAGYTDIVSNTAFSPDGKLLASAGRDKTVRLWDVKTGKQLVALQGNAEYVQNVAFSPDGKLVASAGGDKTIRIWNVKTGKRQAVLTGHTDYIQSVAFSPSSTLLASAGGDKTVRLWSVRTGKQLALLGQHPEYASRVQFNASGDLLLSSGNDIRLWDVKTGALQNVIQPPNGRANHMGLSRDGKWLVSAGPLPNDPVQLWGVIADAPTP